MAKQELYCVVYRTGGTDNFKWQHTLAMSEIDAINTARTNQTAGYKSYVYKWPELLTIGMPDTFDYMVKHF